ncbi:tRNA N6-adenosine threonylcarbamoyltransferase family protein [Babesia bovis T2Bo]|uniref:N(6)-L-threonylcarbamoyladenine synthase n=1 Tax=Babesia bovis TaxID=5865 RepID=A7ATJ4_BABBO|nr:tRNA N6-adenosine threonylcarbamoyltransferase family protein [Babesia bovis T2Bo]EDO06255.1 tRNA N6-adenosine threonylcarbamoyltransferase family protein [Babesia bovis T2Bo]|eukprot:XP_001609823.1 glycoprotease family protein [Babesia bovis T2Bo]
MSGKSLEDFFVLGIEGSANKLGIAVVRGDGVLLSNVRKTYSAPDGEGFLPRHVARHHRENLSAVLREALSTAGIKLSQISLICYTRGPGMGSGLHVGSIAAKTVHFLTGAPIVPVNHCVGHVEMGRHLSGYRLPVVLYVSGGNTQVISYDHVRCVYGVLGETLDVAAGNVLDRLARLLGLPNKPAPGYSIEVAARSGERLISLPFAVKGMDCSLSGLLTYCEQLIERERNLLSSGEITESDFSRFTCDLCFSVQEHMFAMLIEMTERAMSFVGANELLVVGGVGCNLRLQSMASAMAESRGARLYPMDERYCIDNGAMIAFAGLMDYLHGKGSEAAVPADKVSICQRYRTDQCVVTWI